MNVRSAAGDNNGTITDTYDDLNRLKTQTGVEGFVLTFTYEDGIHLTKVTDSLGGTTTNTFDAADRLTTKAFTDGTTSLSQKFTYDNRNAVTQVDRYSDTTQTTKIGLTTFGRDDAGMLTSIVHKNAAGTTTLDSFNYAYDDANNITQETSTLGPTKNYSFDKTNQVLGDGTNTYSWDANGNSTKTGYTTGTNNQLSTDGTWNFIYDAEGNETQKTNISTGAVWLYGYDTDNRLVKAEHKASSTSAVDMRDQFGYDVKGNRIWKSVDADGDGPGLAVTTKYAYDGNGNAWVDYTGTSTIVARHIFGDGTDALIANIVSGSTTWYLQDNLGSTRDLTNSAGSLIDHLDYATFGKVSYESVPGSSDRFGFQSREGDSETGLGYFRARYVGFDTGRFLSQDPIGFTAGDPNLYRFVGTTRRILPIRQACWVVEGVAHQLAPYRAPRHICHTLMGRRLSSRITRQRSPNLLGGLALR